MRDALLCMIRRGKGRGTVGFPWMLLLAGRMPEGKSGFVRVLLPDRYGWNREVAVFNAPKEFIL